MRHLLGIDAGGSKTVCLLANEAGEVLTCGLGGPANPHTVGIQNTQRAISQSVQQAISKSKPGKVEVAYVGAAGVDRASDREILTVLMNELAIAESCYIDNDAAIALAGGTICKAGVVVISGTGSIAFGMNSRGERARSGGWGPILGDEGSGYDIGRRSLVAVMRSHDGRGPETTLTARIRDYLKLGDLSELVQHVYEARPEIRHVAELATLALEESQSGDPVSRQIVTEAVEELTSAAVSVVRMLDMEGQPVDVVASGGVFEHRGILLEHMRESLRNRLPKARLMRPRFEPAAGAILLGLKALGVKLDDIILARMDNSLRAFSELG